MNLSKIKRQRMLDFLETIREQHNNDNNTVIAINEIENELTNKKYGLVWEEHSEKVDEMLVNNIPVFTEDKSREIISDPSLPCNFLIEGDNLHSLKLLEKTHKGKIDVIYIDPPYNLGNGDFIYDDKRVDKDDNYKHSKWLSFMERRLKFAYNLLSLRGMIFISIDDNEMSPLKLLCDEIFNAKNCVAQLVWEKKKKGSFLSNQITNIKEYVLVYCKDKYNFSGLIGEINPKIETYPCINASNRRSVCKVSKGIKSNYREKNFVVSAGTVISDSTMNIKYLTDLVIEDGIVTKDFEVESNWRYNSDKMYEYSLNQELYITNALYIRRIVSTPRYKTMKDLLSRVGDDENATFNTPININNLFDSGWGSNEDADNELIDFFGTERIFSYPKPVRLIKKLICSTRIADAVVLDFFSGSGTTAEAVLELNKQDGGNRKFILCTNNENNICEEITYQRIKTVITGIRKDGSKYSDGIKANLKYMKTDFVPKSHSDIQKEILKHTNELIELKHHTNLSNQEYLIIKTDNELDLLEKNFSDYPNLKGLYIYSDVLLSNKQKILFKNLDIKFIPDYFYRNELCEIGAV